jgi:hypothetical protein
MEGDLVVQIDSAADPGRVLSVWSKWQMQLNYAVIRRIGVVSTDSIMDRLARAQGHWPTTDSVLPSVMEDISWNYPKAHLEVERSPGTSSRDFWRALATVGARPVAQIDPWGPGAETVIALLDHDSSYAAHNQAARQLRWLVEIGQVEARKAADSTASSDLLVSLYPPPPRNEGTAWRDQRVRRFVARANLPNLHAIQDALYLKAYDIVFFSAIYGSPGDVYPSRTGLRVGDRIGWLESSHSPDSVSSRFQFRTDDRFLQGPFLDTLLAIDRRKNGYPYLSYNHYLPTLVSQPTVLAPVLRRCARLAYQEPACPGNAVLAAAVRLKDWEALTLLIFRNPTGESVYPAQKALVALAPKLLHNSRVPPATWGAIMYSIGRWISPSHQDSLLVAQFLAHPRWGRRFDLVAPLVGTFPSVADHVASRIPGGGETREALKKVLLNPWGETRLAARLLDEAVRSRNQAVLSALVNVYGIPQGIRSEAARHLPASMIFLYEPHPTPPDLH